MPRLRGTLALSVLKKKHQAAYRKRQLKKYLDLKKKVLAKKLSGVPRSEYANDLVEMNRIQNRLNIAGPTESEDDISSDEDVMDMDGSQVSPPAIQVIFRGPFLSYNFFFKLITYFFFS